MAKTLLALSVGGLPLVLWLLRSPGRAGGLGVEAGCGVLFIRDVTMVMSGAPAKLKPLPRFLLLAEVSTSGTATIAGLWVWVWLPFVGKPLSPDDGHALASRTFRGRALRLAAAAAVGTLCLHPVRQAIYLGADHGRVGPAADR